jgi:pimeloyl-ACP methyl ester carboxylesterase
VSKDDRRVAGSVRAVIAEHRAAGRAFEAAGVTSFVRAAGHGEPIVMMHGLPSSSFLYRKVISELASQGFRAMAFDLPGLGLADRPTSTTPSTGLPALRWPLWTLWASIDCTSWATTPAVPLASDWRRSHRSGCGR